jgi:sugar transferase EpsL
MLKRIFDLVIASTALLLAGPVMLIIVLGVWCVMGRPILLCQTRPGLQGKPFTILKFRTMNEGIEADAVRMATLGAFLRRTSLDELPELWNVIRGDMSLVGPRPLLMQYLERYSSEQMRRHEVLPGITGWAQVNGRHALSWEERLTFDVVSRSQRSVA